MCPQQARIEFLINIVFGTDGDIIAKQGSSLKCTIGSKLSLRTRPHHWAASNFNYSLGSAGDLYTGRHCLEKELVSLYR
jgi:hypothetical protein